MTNIVILTGAGISVESGIEAFRAEDGTWANHNVDDVATPKGFMRNPKLVHDFYNGRRAKLKEVEPNPAHLALAKLEQRWGEGGFLLVTQNVDDLHERAGSKNLAHMHGQLRRIKCVSCTYEAEIDRDTTEDDACPKCTLPIRPDVVWFGEMPHYLTEIESVLDRADIYLAIGTSHSVMPASLFCRVVSQNGRQAEVIEVNPNPTDTSGMFWGTAFTRQIAEAATIGVPQIVDELLDNFGKRFTQLAAEGIVGLDEIDDFVERWHGAPHLVGTRIFEYLGMTEEEYAAWAKDPDALAGIVAARSETAA